MENKEDIRIRKKKEQRADRKQEEEVQTRRLWLLEWWPWRAFSASAWNDEMKFIQKREEERENASCDSPFHC